LFCFQCLETTPPSTLAEKEALSLKMQKELLTARVSGACS